MANPVPSLMPVELLQTIVFAPLAISSDRSAIEAIELMRNSHECLYASNSTDRVDNLKNLARSKCVAIIEDDKLLGLLTATDVVRLCAERQDLSALMVRSVMNRNSVTLEASAVTNLSVAIDLLDRQRSDCLAIVNDRDCLLGIVTRELLQSWLIAELTITVNCQSDRMQVDIAERERNLQKLSKRLSLALKSGSIGCWEMDLATGGVMWDERMCELYGQSPSLAASLHHEEIYAIWSATVHPDDFPALADLQQQCMFGRADFCTEFRVIHPDGDIHFIKAYGLVTRDELDCPQSVVGINFDITTAKREEAIRLQAEQTIRQQAEREFVLRNISQRIRKSLDLSTVFDTAVCEIRALLETDRVAIFKFATDDHFGEGKFVAESVAAGFVSILGQKILDLAFGSKLVRYYQQGRSNIIENIYDAGLSDDDVNILSQFQVRANLVIPILDGHQLWGLLCIHHCAAPRYWQESEINFVKQIAEQIGIGIQQATLYAKVQAELAIRWQAEDNISRQLKQQQALAEIAQQIRNSLKIQEILKTATERVRELMGVDRVSIFRLSKDRYIRAVEEIVSPAYSRLISRNWETERVSQEEFEFYLKGKANIVDDIQQDIWSENLQAYVTEIGVKSKIVVPILLPVQDSKTYRRSAINDGFYLWGLLSIHACSSLRQWQDSEAKLLQQIADQLAIAIQQASLFERLHAELDERERAELQLRQRNQELARATQLKDEFLANMSHELRTPLNAVLGLAEGLAAANFGSVNERQQRALATIEKSGTHLLALINDILDLSKIEADRLKLELTEVPISSLCKNSVLFVKELAHKKQIPISIDIPATLHSVTLRVDDLRFRQILINLLSNAIKFTPLGGQVTLSVEVVRADGDGKWQIAFSVNDTGIGIAPENLSKLFRSFVQIDSSLNRQYAGTGLGLALVKRLAELHGGNVAVSSEVGRGSCFTVYLPFEPGVIKKRGRSDSSPISGDLQAPEALATIPEKALVLIADDNEANLETMRSYLQTRSYRLLEATNGRCAIDLALAHRPDIILMDIQMPDMDGLEAIARIRQIPDIAGTIVVAVTALAMNGDRQKCLDAGANDYITKPLKLSQLVATIENLLQGE